MLDEETKAVKEAKRERALETVDKYLPADKKRSKAAKKAQLASQERAKREADFKELMPLRN